MIKSRVIGCLLLFCSPALFAATADSPSYQASDLYLLILFVIISVGVSFLCSIAEAVLLSISPAYIEHHKSQHPKQAALLLDLRVNKIDSSLAAILTLNTIAHTVGAIIAGAKAAQIFGNAWIGLFSAGMTLAILLLSEIVPKTIGALHWKGLAPATAYFVRGLIFVLFPLIWLSEKITKWIAKDKKVPLFSREEFIAMAGVGKETGGIEDYESRIIKNLFHFAALTAHDIMTPRTVITALDEKLSIDQAYKKAIAAPFSRFPVYQEHIDEISGFVLKDDILNLLGKGDSQAELRQLKREIPCVLANKKLAELLDFLLERKQHMALIVDEYGATEGLVTLEDLLETLLGVEIMDEVDRVEDMQRLARNMWKRRAKARGIELGESEITK